MEKLLLIIRREYITRVTRKSFILATLLTPLAFALFFVIIGVIFSYEDGDVKRVAILDEAGLLETEGISNSDNLIFIKEDRGLEELRAQFDELDYDGILRIPPITNLYAQSYTIYYYSEKTPTLSVETLLSQRINQKIENYKIRQLGLDEEQLKALDSRVSINPEPVDATEEDSSRFTGAIGAGIGGFMGFFMYITVFVYGMMVMRSVMEEKTSRIVEVMISSVRPFQLMLGKIIGVGAVGLTQIAAWAILIPGLGFLVTLIFGFDAAGMQGNMPAGAESVDPDEAASMVQQVMIAMGDINWGSIIILFLLYFIGGFFLYSSLFAAVGSAMSDDLGESQSLTLPITIPVIIAFYIMIRVVESPDSNLAVWSSIIPLFSPIVMPARLAFDPPLWQVLLSVATLFATCLLFIWISARIYRVGILMYGKKVTLRTLGKWMFYRD